MTKSQQSQDGEKGKSKPQLIAEIEALKSRVREFELEPKTHKRSNHLLRSFIDVLPDCGCSFDADGKILEILAGKASPLHSNAPKLKGQSIHNFLPKQDAESLLAVIKETIETKRPGSFEFELSVLAGRRWFIAKTMALNNGNTGSPIINCILEDITNQKITAGTLKDVREELGRQSLEKLEQEDKFRALVEGSVQGIAVTKNRRILFANQALADLLGFDSPEEVLALASFDEIVVPEDRALLRERAEARIHGGDVSAFYDTTYLGKDNHRIDVSILNSVIEWDGDSAILTTIINITERKIAEKELKNSEQRFKDFAEISSDWFWEMGPDLKFTWFSDRVEEVTGVPVKFHIGKSRQNIAAEGEEREKWGRHLNDLENRKPYRNFTFWRKGPDGNLQYMTSSGVPVFDENKKFLGYRGTGSDITQQKKTEEALQENETRLQNFIDLAPSNLVYIDKNFRYRQVNARYLDFLGKSKEEILNHTIIEVLGDEDFQRYLPWIKKVLQGQEQHFEVPRSVSLKDLEFRDLELRFVPSVDSGGRVMGFYASIEDITERKRAETSLTESNKNLSEALQTLDMAIEAMSSGFALWDRNNELVICNNQFRNLYPAVKHLIVPGVNFEKMIRASVQTGEVLDAVGQEEEWIQKRLREHHNPSGSVFYKLATGRWIQAVERKTSDGGIVGERIDITELKQAEEALREREAQLRTFIDLSPSNLVYIDRDLVYRQVNAGYLVFVGKSEEEVIGHTIAEVVGEDAFELNRVAIEEVLQGKIQYFEIARSVGELGVRNLEVRYVPNFEEDQLVGYYGSVQDITERKVAEEELRESRDQLRLITDNLPVLITYMDRNLRFKFANKTAHQWYARESGDVLGKSAFDLFPQASLDLVKDLYSAVFSGELVNDERQISYPEGIDRNVQLTYVPDFDDAGEVIGFFGLAQDITEHKQAREALRKSEELLKAIFNNSPALISLKDLEGRYLLVNQRFEEWSGIPPEKVIGYTTHDVHPKELADQLAAQDMEVLQTGKVIVGEVFIGPGEHDYRDNTKFPVLDGNGKIAGVGTIGTDIFERRQAENRMKLQEQQLIQADKMASLGTMVAGVAHEINNPNSFITFNAPIIASIWNDALPILKRYQEESGELTLGSLPYDKAVEAMPRLLSAISSGAERIASIVYNLKDFARQDFSAEFKPVNLNDVLASAVALLNNEIKKNTKDFSVEYGADLPEVLGEFQKIEQVVINLITNSCQALPNPEKAVRVKTDYDANSKTVRLTVADEGEGISPENLAKIMDPFFTTKRDTGGTGLGLSVSYSIMEEHGGKLEFSSTEGKSTTAIMSLPLNERPRSKATGNS